MTDPEIPRGRDRETHAQTAACFDFKLWGGGQLARRAVQVTPTFLNQNKKYIYIYIYI